MYVSQLRHVDYIYIYIYSGVVTNDAMKEDGRVRITNETSQQLPAFGSFVLDSSFNKQKQMTYPYAPLVRRKNRSCVNGVPIWTVPFTARFRASGTYSM